MRSVFVLLLIFGLYLPSSLSGNPSKILLGIGYGLVFVLGARLNRVNWRWYPVAALIPGLILFFTFWSGLTTYALGALLPFSAMAFMLLVRIENLEVSSFTKRVFIACNVANIVLGFGMILGWANNFVATWYAYISPEFVQERMLDLHKPVLTFYVHSVAALMIYLFFYLCLRSFQMESKRIYGVFCFCYLVLVAALLSTSSTILFCIGSIQFSLELWRTRHRLILSAIVATLFLFTVRFWEPISDSINFVRSAEGGFSGRYSANTETGSTVKYLIDHPFSPIGASGREGIMLGDSGPVSYMLRGSLPLTFLIYGGYFWFLKRNLRYRQDLIVLFFGALGFEFGAPILTYYRFLLLIPFVCVYLNSLPAVPVVVPNKVRWWKEIARWSVVNDPEFTG